ncbi:MAG: PEGA domain-containing protein [Chitinivibrionales bacterium]|nr:PEGA domain-containing protein [Chitinivibrionales bacterium]
MNTMATGIGSFSTEPSGAELFINGEYAGKTPLLRELGQGNHAISLSYLNYHPCDTSITIVQGEKQSFAARLERVVTVDTIHPKSAAKPAPEKEKRGLLSIFRKLRREPEPGPAPKPADRITKHPAYIKAMNDMKFGRYATAIERLAPLVSIQNAAPESKSIVLEKIALCYKKDRRFDKALSVYTTMYEFVESRSKKDNLLWEMITIKIDRMQDYEHAEMDLVEYLIAYPDGIWLSEAYIRLAEIQYLLDKPEASARTYKKHIEHFAGSQEAGQSIYALAQICRTELDDCSRAIQWYTRLISEYPRSTYKENCIFWRAECFSRLGRSKEAKKEYQHYLSHFPTGRWKQAAAARMQAR